jgi:hypothetical protein
MVVVVVVVVLMVGWIRDEFRNKTWHPSRVRADDVRAGLCNVRQWFQMGSLRITRMGVASQRFGGLE